MQRRGLGRGLDALLPETEGVRALQDIPVVSISPNPFQPRRRMDEASLRELASSLRRTGVLQPVIVRPQGDGYQLIAGERRWRAAQIAGLERIPAVVREATNAETLELALVENLLREDLNPIEEAEAYQRLLTEFQWSQEELAQRVGRDRSTIANALRLLKLPPLIQEDLREGRLTMGHARALLGLSSPRDQMRLREQIVTRGWSVRSTEQMVRKARGRQGRSPSARRPELRSIQEGLQEVLRVKVQVTGRLERGRIEIYYSSAEELDEIYRKIAR